MQGILHWSDCWLEIIANSVFHKNKGILRKITRKEMERVLDYQKEKLTKMMEEQIILLTRNEEIPGKIIYSTLFSLSCIHTKWERSEVSTKQKRKGVSETNLDAPFQKRSKIKKSDPNYVDIKEKHLTIEDLLEYVDLKLAQKEMEDEEKGEGEPSAKAVKADNSKVSVHLWNDGITQKLTAYWKEEVLKD